MWRGQPSGFTSVGSLRDVHAFARLLIHIDIFAGPDSVLSVGNTVINKQINTLTIVELLFF